MGMRGGGGGEEPREEGEEEEPLRELSASGVTKGLNEVYFRPDQIFLFVPPLESKVIYVCGLEAEGRDGRN